MRAGTGFGLNPTRLKGRGGRKLIITPEGATAAARKRSRDDTLMKALIHRHRWQRKIDSGQAGPLEHRHRCPGERYGCGRLVDHLTCFPSIPHGQ
jgi:hypothetical protein